MIDKKGIRKEKGRFTSMNKFFLKDYQRILADKEKKNESLIKNFVRYHEIRFLYFYRNKNRLLLRRYRTKYGLEIYSNNIGEGFYLGHAFNITINKDAIIGRNCNVHKGVTIGQENRGKRRGTPVIRR